MSDERAELEARFLSPQAEYGVFTTWFWNDDLEEAELLRQLRAFAVAGFGGVMIHARVGLARRIGYLTPEWFRLCRVVVGEAARLGMKVMLYDEGSYPSGSAQGRVTAEDPGYASRCLIPVSRAVSGPARGWWRPNPGRALCDEMLSAVAARETGEGALDPATLAPLSVEGRGLVRYELPAGSWRIATVWSAFSGARIRGVHPEEDDGHALAPAAGDIMSEAAVACFIRHTHERYAEALGEHFGSTVVALFTDEPNALGRSPQRGPRPVPYTPGLLGDLRDEWRRASGSEDAESWLAALWFDLGHRGAAMRELYRRAVERRIRRVFYGAQRRWCEAHRLALTGHPSASGDLASLECFHWPGQDMVWRYVEPGTSTALEGEHSVAAKVAGSAAALGGKPRASAEIYGAYGWRLSADEMKWLLDWHLARGVNCVIPHASFYSLRGRRAFESEPDFGLHSTLWPAIAALARYARRCCAMLAGSKEVCDTAVLTDPERAAWAAAAELYRAQVDFLYLDAAAVAGGAVRGGALHVGAHAFRAVVCDGAPELPEIVRERLRELEGAGGLVLERWSSGGLAEAVRARHEPHLLWSGGADLRVLHVERRGAHVYFLANEGEGRLRGELSLQGSGRLELWDAWTGLRRPCRSEERGGRLALQLGLERRQSALLVRSPGAAAEPDGGASAPEPGEPLAPGIVEWSVSGAAGDRPAPPPLRDWAQLEGFETFSGTVTYRGTLELDAAAARAAEFLDLGAVGEIAEVAVNGRELGVAAWAPYVVPLGGSLRPGRNLLELRVSNSMANACDGLQLPSGLMGPVLLRRRASP